jgi:hypothetical protein
LRNASVAAKQWLLALGCLLFASATAVIATLWPSQYTYPLQFYSPDGNRSWLTFVDEVRISGIQGAFLVPIGEDFDEFQLRARKEVWVWKSQGAAVMWLPSFYAQWMPRYEAVLQLRTPLDFVTYAQNNGIHNVVVKTESGACPAPATTRIASPPYFLCEL